MNYNKLVAFNPTIYDIFTNSRGQLIELVEHPTKGDEYPVIAICHALKLAESTDFWDIDDMRAEHGEYEPYFDEEGNLEYGRNE